MDLFKTIQILVLLTVSCAASAAVQTQIYTVTDNSYYTYYDQWSGTTESTLTGTLLTSLEINSDYSVFTVTVDYSNLLIDDSPFQRPNDTLTTNYLSFTSGHLISGLTTEDDIYTYTYGNATIINSEPLVCVECSYDFQLKQDPNLFFIFGDTYPYTESPLLLSYHESNPYETGKVDFELYIAPVPLPASIWLLGSGFIGLLGFAGRKKI